MAGRRKRRRIGSWNRRLDLVGSWFWSLRLRRRVWGELNEVVYFKGWFTIDTWVSEEWSRVWNETSLN